MNDDRQALAGRLVIPPHVAHEVPWCQATRGGSIEDRKLRSVVTSIPPDIDELSLAVPGELTSECDDAVRAIAALDAARGDHLRPLATLLLRAESVASSKIEHEEASVEDYALALHGIKSNASATSMVAAGGAMDRLLRGPIDAEGITSARAKLMAEDLHEARYAGRWRDVQNWIGGSDYSPRGALYVPPPAELVEEKMADLIRFSNRTDVPVIAQAAVAHAQFESIHPFTDGNGRIGRALAATIIRYRGVARNIVVPIASALVAQRDRYFDSLNAYRRGDGAPIVDAFARSALIAAEEAQSTADRLAVMPEQWHQQVGDPRRSSAPALLIASLAAEPIFTADDAERRLGISTATVYRAIDRLSAAGVIRPLTNRERDQVWGAGSLLDELDDLGIRIATRARTDWQ